MQGSRSHTIQRSVNNTTYFRASPFIGKQDKALYCSVQKLQGGEGELEGRHSGKKHGQKTRQDRMASWEGNSKEVLEKRRFPRGTRARRV